MQNEKKIYEKGNRNENKRLKEFSRQLLSTAISPPGQEAWPEKLGGHEVHPRAQLRQREKPAASSTAEHTLLLHLIREPKE